MLRINSFVNHRKMNLTPLTIQMERRPNESLGFTLRHMVVNPTNPDAIGATNHNSETLYVLEVNQNSRAQFAGLLPGDKIIMVNDLLVSNSPFMAIQNEIRNTTNLSFNVAPRSADTLQMDFEDVLWDDQLKFLNSTLHHPLNKSYPIKKGYQYAFLKAFVHALEKNGKEVHDTVYEELAALCRKSEDASNFTYKHYTVPSRNTVITLKESKTFISEGTTGLCSWQASIALSEWLIHNPEKIAGKITLELGAGTGLTGMVAAKCCQAKEVTLTDGSIAVVNLLNENVDLNFGNDQTLIKTNLLNWEEKFELIGTDVALPEVLLGADITFDNSVFPALIRVLEKIFKATENSCVLYLAATIRNDVTFDKFQKLMDKHNFELFEEKYIPPSTELFWEESTLIRIFSVTR